MRQIAITGAHAITPRGPLTAEGFAHPPSPFSMIRRFGVADFPVKIAAEVEAIDPVALGLSSLVGALPEASRLRLIYGEDRVGVFVGAEPERARLEDLSVAQSATPALAKDAYHHRSPARLTERLIEALGVAGPRATLSMACAASASAAASAFRSLSRGLCDAAVCVGAALNVEPLLFAGFCLLRAMSTSGRSRPFDQDRDGFVLSDGAGALILEAADRVKQQGREREILGYLEGVGESLDAYRITDPEPEGKGARAAISLALQCASLRPEEVSLVKAHATGTLQNDRVEAKVLSQLFPHEPPVLALKGGIGHSIAACGVVELISALASLRRGLVEDAYLLSSFDRELSPINVRPWSEGGSHERAFSGRLALCNTFGFGGINCALLISAP